MRFQMIMVRGTEAETQLRELEAFASRPENWFTPPYRSLPGDDPSYVRKISVMDISSGETLSYRVVFSYSVIKGETHRHLSLSLEDGREPNELAIFTITRFLGFTGSLEDWEIGTSPMAPGVLAVLQKVPVVN